MNSQFNLKRFGMLFKKHVAEHYKTYLMAFIVLIGVLSLVCGIINYMSNKQLPKSVQQGIFLTFSMLAGTIFTSTIFADLSDKKRTIAALTLPASHLEKFLVGWLVSYVVFQVIFFSGFYAVVSLVISTNPSLGPDFGVYNIFADKNFLLIYLTVFAMLHAMALCGAIFFEKLHFIKTAFTFFIVLIILSIVNKPVMAAAMHHELIGDVLWSPVSFMENGRNYNIRVPGDHGKLMAYFGGALALVLWASAYFRLTEKEV